MKLFTNKKMSTDYTNLCGNCRGYIGSNKYCPYCGTKAGEGKFEPYPIEEMMQCVYGPPPVTRVHKCPDCGYTYSTCVMIDNQRYCPECGSGKVSVREKSAEVRRARKEDIPVILNLLLQVASVHRMIRPDLFKSKATKYTAEELEEMIKDDENPIFVCEDRYGRVTGYAMCQTKQYIDHNVLTDVKTLYIDDICVDQNLRQSGFGREIFEYVRDWAKENGYYNITLFVWSGNDVAKYFYENMDMVPYKVGMELILNEKEES